MGLADLLQSKQDSSACLLATGNLEWLLVSVQAGYTPQTETGRVFSRGWRWGRWEVSLIWRIWNFLLCHRLKVISISLSRGKVWVQLGDPQAALDTAWGPCCAFKPCLSCGEGTRPFRKDNLNPQLGNKMGSYLHIHFQAWTYQLRHLLRPRRKRSCIWIFVTTAHWVCWLVGLRQSPGGERRGSPGTVHLLHSWMKQGGDPALAPPQMLGPVHLCPGGVLRHPGLVPKMPECGASAGMPSTVISHPELCPNRPAPGVGTDLARGQRWLHWESVLRKISRLEGGTMAN